MKEICWWTRVSEKVKQHAALCVCNNGRFMRRGAGYKNRPH